MDFFKKHKKASIIIGVIILLLLVYIVAPKESKEPLQYEIVTNETVADDFTFRIIVDKDYSEKQCKEVFKELDFKDNDNITAWFYSSKKAVDDGCYDVAMIESTNGGYTSKVTMK